MMDKKIHPILLYGLPVLFAALLKAFIWPEKITPFNADEAVVALMARHINQGQLPAFFYGQYYMGSLDALLIAPLFKLFGEQVWVIRAVQSALYLGTVVTTVLLATRVLKNQRAALYAGLMAAIPTMNVALYTTVSLGGYGEMLLVGNLLLLGGVGIIEQLQGDPGPSPQVYWGLAAWGLGAGFAFWVVALTLVYSIPILIGLLWVLIKKSPNKLPISLTCLTVGGILGSSPWWGAAIQAGNLQVVTELVGGALAGVGEGSPLILPLKRFLSLVVFGGSVMTGMRPPWSIQWLMLPLLPLALVFWMAVLYHSARQLIRDNFESDLSLVGLMGVVLAAGFVLSPYGDDPSGRYFVPLLIPMSLFAADMIVRETGGKKILELALVGFILVYNAGGIIQSVRQNPPGLTTQFDQVAQVDHSRIEDLIDFLEANKIQAGYSNYWVSYPLAFLTQEEIILVPRLPYHEDFRYTSRDDRYLPYAEVVASAEDLAYITTHHPALNAYLEEQFQAHGISFQEKTIGDYTVYYQLSSPLRVEEIGLGVTTNP